MRSEELGSALSFGGATFPPANGTSSRAKFLRYRKRPRIASDSSQQKKLKPPKNRRTWKAAWTHDKATLSLATRRSLAASVVILQSIGQAPEFGRQPEEVIGFHFSTFNQGCLSSDLWLFNRLLIHLIRSLIGIKSIASSFIL